MLTQRWLRATTSTLLLVLVIFGALTAPAMVSNVGHGHSAIESEHVAAGTDASGTLAINAHQPDRDHVNAHEHHADREDAVRAPMRLTTCDPLPVRGHETDACAPHDAGGLLLVGDPSQQPTVLQV